MKNLSSWLLVMFMFMFWVFRIIVAYQGQLSSDFGGFIAFNQTIEVILLFIVILCMILTLRRNILGGIIYLISYGYYFGGYILTNLMPALLNSEALGMNILQNTMASGVRTCFGNMCIFRFNNKYSKKKRSKR